MIDADNVSIEGFEISGFGRGILGGFGKPDTQTQIVGNTIYDCSGSCIQLGHSSNVEVARNTLVGGENGIFVGGGSAANVKLHIHHNRVIDTRGDGIRLAWAPGSKLDHNVIKNSGWHGIYLAESPNCTADQNQTDHNAWAGIAVGKSPNCAVTGNKANSNEGSGIDVWLSSGSSLKNNQTDNNGSVGIHVSDSEKCALTGNEVNNNANWGIYIGNSSGSSVVNNQTDNNGLGDWLGGIAVVDSFTCKVINNVVSNNTFFGIYVRNSLGSSFELNVATGHRFYDLFCDDRDPASNTYLNNQAGTACPSLELWDVESSQ
jgi:parallel beta-helix repeat protein